MVQVRQAINFLGELPTPKYRQAVTRQLSRREIILYIGDLFYLSAIRDLVVSRN